MQNLVKKIEARIYEFHKCDYISYLDKIKCIKFNISPLKNNVLFTELVDNKISVEEIVRMKSAEMATYDKLEDRNIAKKRNIFDGFMSKECRSFQKASILAEDQCKKAKLWGANEETLGKLN